MWVQCSLKKCLKWRFLPTILDPSSLPEHWTCDMNDDPDFNKFVNECKANHSFQKIKKSNKKFCYKTNFRSVGLFSCKPNLKKRINC